MRSTGGCKGQQAASADRVFVEEKAASHAAKSHEPFTVEMLCRLSEDDDCAICRGGCILGN